MFLLSMTSINFLFKNIVDYGLFLFYRITSRSANHNRLDSFHKKLGSKFKAKFVENLVGGAGGSS